METKDINRLQDIKNQPSEKHIGLATKMSKLITNADKAQGRYEAAWVIFGDNHPVTNIFAKRVAQLTSEPAHPVHTSAPVVETKVVQEEAWTPPACW